MLHRYVYLTISLSVWSSSYAATDSLLENTRPHNLTTVSSEYSARGVINTRNRAVLASNMNAQIIKMPYFEGDHFAKGAVLVEFDCRKPLAEMKSARATESIHKQKVAANQELASFDSISTYEVEVSKAELIKSEAEREALQTYITGCVVKAPFEGSVQQRMVNKFETVAANEPLLSVIDDTHLEISIIVPSVWLRWLEIGSQFIFKVDEISVALNASISRISPVVDPVSRTIRIIGELTEEQVEEHGILTGMSGVAKFEHRDDKP